MGAKSKKLDDNDRLMTPEEVAELLVIEVPTLHKWFREGTMPVQRIQKGTYIRYRWSDIQAWLYVLTVTPGGIVDPDLTISTEQPVSPFSAKEAAEILSTQTQEDLTQ